MTEEEIKFIKWILAQENLDEGLAKLKAIIELGIPNQSSSK